MNHLKNTKSLTREFIEGKLFPLSDSLRDRNFDSPKLKRKTLFSLFYEPSFLTRISFERSITLLGGHTLHTEDASQFFPVTNTNYIEDTVEILNSLHIDGVVIRSSEPGIIERACKSSRISVINGGSYNDHPTQAIADLYTIDKELGSIDNKTITIMGRLEHRNVSAFMSGLSLFENVLVKLLPFSGEVSSEVQDICRKRNVKIENVHDLKQVSGSDVVYLNSPRTVTHFQLLKSRGFLISNIDDQFMSMLKPDSIVLDPMQRSGDFSIETNDSRVAFYRQSENALFVRMAILCELLGQ